MHAFAFPLIVKASMLESDLCIFKFIGKTCWAYLLGSIIASNVFGLIQFSEAL